MALPTDRESFKAYCLRRLGDGVTKINVADLQVEDRIDDALQMFRDYHMDGSQRQYLAHQVTQTDKDNRYFQLDAPYFGVVRTFELGTALGSQNLFSLTYQFAQSDFLSSALTGSMVPYWMAMTQIQLIQYVLIGKQPVRFTESTGRLYVDTDWGAFAVGDYVVIECFEALDPDVYPKIWQNRWLLRYCTALIKRQWGEHLKKYANMPLAGGLTFNGQQIYDEAIGEIEKLEQSVIDDYGVPVVDMIS